MPMRLRRGLLVAAGLTVLTAGPAFATGACIEKPPGVPPEVEAARETCPTVVGPCFGYFPTKWRVLPCCAPEPTHPGALPPATSIPAGAAYGPRRSGTSARAAAQGPENSAAVLRARPMPKQTTDREPAARPAGGTDERPIRAWVAGDDR